MHLENAKPENAAPPSLPAVLRGCPGGSRTSWQAAFACCFLLACDPDSPGESNTGRDAPSAARQDREAGHRRMLELLDRIAGNADRDNPYLGKADAEELRREVAGLDSSSSPRERWRLHLGSGLAELRLGNERTAIEQLEISRGLLAAADPEPPWGSITNFHLGVAYVRLGETQNCCLRNNRDSCILPIRGGGLHAIEEGSRKALEPLTAVLEDPGGAYLYKSAQWLLNVAHMTLGEYPGSVPERFLIPPEAFGSDVDFPRFWNIAPNLGLSTFNLCGGAVADDFDGDGYLDIAASTYDPKGQLRLFGNNRDGSFRDRTDEAGLRGLFGGLNLVQTDFNNDGHLDLLVLRGAWWRARGAHPNSLLRNDGGGNFADVTFAAGLGEVHYPTQTGSWADYDNDGDLDLYIGNEHTDSLRAPCQLFRNDGDETFTDVAASAGVENYGFSKGVVWGDFDDDGFSDLYVSNLKGTNRLYRNRADGTFVDVAPELDVTWPIWSLPAWFWDFDNDGALDIFVATYTGRSAHVAAHYLDEPTGGVAYSCLYRGDGEGGFQEVASRSNLTQPILAMGANFGDLDNDGYLDFYLGTGDPDYWNIMPNLMFLNDRGRGFLDVTTAGGFGHLQKGHAIAFADLDNDGDSDVFEQMGGAFPGDRYGDALYENPGFGNHWIAVKLVGTRSNRAAIGARIRAVVVEGGAERSIYRHVNSGGSFGGNPLRQTIGLGAATKIERLEIFWPASGRTQSFVDVPADQAIRIVEGEGSWTRLELEPLRLAAAAVDTLR